MCVCGTRTQYQPSTESTESGFLETNGSEHAARCYMQHMLNLELAMFTQEVHTPKRMEHAHIAAADGDLDYLMPMGAPPPNDSTFDCN